MRNIGDHVSGEIGKENPVPGQARHTWLRLLFAALTALYLWVNGMDFGRYGLLYGAMLAAYLLYGLLALLHIHHAPHSTPRIFFTPLFDTAVMSIAMYIDGGQASHIFPLFLLIILGHGLRFGNTVLLYAQVLSLLAILAVCGATVWLLRQPIDAALLALQLAILLLIPAYALKIGKASREAIRRQDEAEATSYGLFDSSPMPAFIFRARHSDIHILYGNAALYRLYREHLLEPVGQSVTQLALPEDSGELLQACARALEEESDQPRRFYFRGPGPDGQALRLMGQAVRMRWHGEMLGICFLLDITQTDTLRNELRQNAQSNYMSTLVAGIVHDFRNVLTSIMGTAEMLRFNSRDKAEEAQLNLILDAGERGARMTTHLLNLGKAQHRKQGRLQTGEELRATINSIIGLLRIQLPPHVVLHLNISEPLPPVRIDISHLEEIITNLVQNSAQAMQGSGEIEVSLDTDAGHAVAAEGAPALKIAVRDSGCGIPEEDLDKITKPFWSSRKDEGGTGLGLAMVQRIVQSYGGTLAIESKIGSGSGSGSGTCITIHIPSAKPEAAAAARPRPEQARPAAAAAAAGGALAVLLVDDSLDVLAVHRSLLEHMGHRVFPFASPETALTHFRNHADEIDVLVTDFRMPVMDGLDFALAARGVAPDLPVIIITAFGESEKLASAEAHDIRVLHKPVTYAKLAEELARIPAAHAAPAQRQQTGQQGI